MNPPAAATSVGVRAVLRRHWLAATLGTIMAIITACLITAPPKAGPVSSGGGSAGGPTYEVHGFLSLTGPDGVLVSRTDTVDKTNDPKCWGQSQYRDIAYGTQITVYDDQDAIVAYGSLDEGRVGRLSQPPNAGCVFPFVIADVPAGSSFYQVGIASRGTVQVLDPPVDGVLYAWAALDEVTGSLPPVADQPPRLPTVVD